MNNHIFKGNLITLDNNVTYEFIWGILLENKNYCYMININDFSDIIICEIIDKDSIRVLNDRNEIKKVVRKINEEINLFAY